MNCFQWFSYDMNMLIWNQWLTKFTVFKFVNFITMIKVALALITTFKLNDKSNEYGYDW